MPKQRIERFFDVVLVYVNIYTQFQVSGSLLHILDGQAAVRVDDDIEDIYNEVLSLNPPFLVFVLLMPRLCL